MVVLFIYLILPERRVFMKNPVLKARSITQKTLCLINKAFKNHPDELKPVINAVVSVHSLINERLEEILKGGAYDRNKRN
jgi:hypothetical protein